MTDAVEISSWLVSQLSLTALSQPKQGGRDEKTSFCIPIACTCLQTGNPKENAAQHIIIITFAISQFLCFFSVIVIRF